MHDALEVGSDTVLDAEKSASSVPMLTSTCNFIFGFPIAPLPMFWVPTAAVASCLSVIFAVGVNSKHS